MTTVNVEKEQEFLDNNMLKLYIDTSGGSEYLPEQIKAYGWNLFDLLYSLPGKYLHILVDSNATPIDIGYNFISQNDDIITIIKDALTPEKIAYTFLYVNSFSSNGETTIKSGSTSLKNKKLIEDFANAENKVDFFIKNCESIEDKDLLTDLYEVTTYKFNSLVKMSDEALVEFNKQFKKVEEAYNNAMASKING